MTPWALTRPVAAGDVPVYVADMHFHLFLRRDERAPPPLARAMAEGHATLVAWSLVADLPWIGPAEGSFRQKSVPGPGAAAAWFREDLGRATAYLAAQDLRIVRAPADVARALAGEPHVVLSAEGATFLDEDIDQLDAAYEAGLRHLQLVHFLKNPIADLQTERSEHGGLTTYGRQVVERCNRLGILVDLAHCSGAAVRDVLAVSTKPAVWSHSSVAREDAPQRPTSMWQARQLALDDAKAIAAKGGVIGLWSLPADVGRSVESYADRLAELADLLGEDHVAFGTDRNGVSRPAVGSFADLQRVIRHWQRRGMSASRIRKLAIGNYARVLTAALTT